ncbi:hypothetical protein [Metabacillus halosaccharovorans]|uniref:hypothetical protein n=1 Tax=Metabacillus halosaccharovorans TaxID=930124 RepID=UPI003736E6BD
MKKDDIEGLKQKLIVYKQTLETMKSGNVVEDYLIMKNECYDLIKKISKLENVIETNSDQHNVQITNISQQVAVLKEEIKSMSLSIDNVEKEIGSLTDKVNSLNIDDLMIKMDTLLSNEEILVTSINQEKKELADLKDELIKLKSEVLETNIVSQQQLTQPKTKIQPTSYQQLQSIIKSSTSIKNKLPGFSVPVGRDISNFYQGISKRTQKASFLPPTSPKPQKIELIDQYKESSEYLEETENETEQLIDVQSKTEEEKSILISESTKNPSTDELSLEDNKEYTSIQRNTADE